MLSNISKTGRTSILVLLLVFSFNVTAQTSKPSEQASVKDAGSTNPAKSTGNLTPSQIFSRSRASVVVIIAADQGSQNEALGSGFIVGNNRIVTNHHVLDGMSQAAVVFADGSVKPVSNVIADSREQDLIVVTTQTGNRQPLPFGDELALQQGDSVYALGAPKGLELYFTNGIVSSFRKSNSQFLIQTTAPIAPGSSGGPLFNQAGKVVGVTSSLLADAPGIYFSVGIGDVKRLLRTPLGVTLPLDEWAKQESSAHNPKPSTQATPGNSQQEHANNPLPGPPIYLMNKLSEAHGSLMANGRLHTNVLESGTIIDPSHPCGCSVSHYFPNASNGGEVTQMLDVINLANADSRSIRVDMSTVSVEMSAYAEGKSLVGGTQDLLRLLEGAEQRSGTIYVVLDSADNAQEFARLMRLAVAACGELKERGQPY